MYRCGVLSDRPGRESSRRPARGWVLAVAVVAGIGAAAAGAAERADQPIVVVAIEGTVESGSTSATPRLDLYSVVDSPSRLVLGPSARITLAFIARGREATVSGPGTVDVRPGGVAVVTGKPAIAERELPGVLSAVRLDRNRLKLAATRLRTVVDNPGAVTPVGARHPDEREFRWPVTSFATGYRLLIVDADGAEVHRAEVALARYRLPDSVVFEPGRLYRWAVESVPAAGDERPLAFEFHVAPRELATWLDNTDTAPAGEGERNLAALVRAVAERQRRR